MTPRFPRILPRNAPRRALWLSAALAAGVVLAAGAWYTRETRTELDTTTGTIRRRTLVYGVTVAADREHTWVSRALAMPRGHQGDWQVILQEGFRHQVRANFRYGGAISSIRAFEDFRRIAPLTPEVERLVAERVVGLWQSEGDRDGARELLREVEDRMSGASGLGRPLTREDIGL